jgi:hypothetical protein
MAAVELILLQRVEKLGQMGEIVKVKPGFARNYLLPQKKAIRASKDNLARFEDQRAQLEAQNLKRREEAESPNWWVGFPWSSSVRPANPAVCTGPYHRAISRRLARRAGSRSAARRCCSTILSKRSG